MPAPAPRPEIQVNAIYPGRVKADRVRAGLGNRFDDLINLAERKNIVGSILQPDDVADVAVKLTTGSSQITGEVVRIDGGDHLGRRLTL
jgi:NAD(P)-dependent dehydrogenase (short-subunit alcohol dehydrogenase family)